MRLAPRGDNVLERLALRLNLAPQPVIDLNWGMLSIISSSQAEAMKNAGIALFFYLGSGAGARGTADLSRWVREAGFDEPRQLRIASMPFHQLYTATRLPS